MPSILVTGASRGIGMEYVTQFAAEGWTVLAACRNPDGAADLKSVAGDVSVYKLDVDDVDSTAALSKALAGRPIDVVVNNAGIIGSRAGFDALDYDAWAEAMNTNVFGPMRVSQALMDNVLAGDRKQIIYISSLMGSIERCAGGAYVYRSSKAALNMAVTCLAQEFGPKGVTALLFHPGHVSTEMGGAGAPVTPTQSVTGMKGVILGLSPADNGKFVNFDGTPLPW
jgi:NAD(P)-dependent dehydrogenase (short-subunit alcohol dehydrogenase family)